MTKFNAQKFNCTSRVQDLMQNAALSAAKSGHREINFLHLFDYILTYEGSEVLNAIEFSGQNIESVKNVLDSLLPDIQGKEERNTAISLSKECIALFHAADVLSKRYNSGYISIEHIFIMMNDDPDEQFLILLKKIGGLEKSVDILNRYLATGELPSVQKPQTNDSSPTFPELVFLSKYAINLNEKVKNNQISTLSIDPELSRKVYEILARKNKNNPMIIGEAGVGKTALVECIAYTIVNGTCPDLLSGKKIYALDLAGIVSGCKLRGDFEEKMKGVIDEVISRPDIIVFIDEIHTLIGAGNEENSFDAANILKPYLARGEFTCIGATTMEEYKTSIAKDAALERRFQLIVLEEPTKEKTKVILKNIVSYYEDYHNVSFSDSILDSIIHFADRYLNGRFPDKAIDILDQVGSKLKLKAFNKSPEMLSIEASISQLCKNTDSFGSIQDELGQLQSAYFLETQKMVGKWRENRNNVVLSEILDVISDKTGVPKVNLEQNDKSRIDQIGLDLSKSVVGQKKALECIYSGLFKKYVLNSKTSSITSFLFAGPNNCGKFLTAKSLCRSLYPTTENLIVLDMSSYADKASVFKLIGSPPGYEGHRSGGFLTEKVKNLPNSIIVFRGIEKACPEVLSIVSNILKDGELIDSFGRVVKFKNCIMILTTTEGSSEVSKIGFGGKPASRDADMTESLKKYFSLELIESLDEIVLFNNLDINDFKEIAKRELDKIKNRFYDSGILINFEDSVSSFFAEQAKASGQGARFFLKNIEKIIGSFVSENIPNDLSNILNIGVSSGQIMVIDAKALS